MKQSIPRKVNALFSDWQSWFDRYAEAFGMHELLPSGRVYPSHYDFLSDEIEVD